MYSSMSKSTYPMPLQYIVTAYILLVSWTTTSHSSLVAGFVVPVVNHQSSHFSPLNSNLPSPKRKFNRPIHASSSKRYSTSAGTGSTITDSKAKSRGSRKSRTTTMASLNQSNLSVSLENDTTQNSFSLSTFSSKYKQLTTDYYLLMAFLQAGVLASSADMATQTMEHAGPLDFSHVAAMAAVASTMSGLMNAIWLKQLESKFPGTGAKEVATKTMIHAVIIASIINSAYLVFVPMFTAYGFTPAAFDLNVITSNWSWEEFIILTKLEILMFIPYNTVAFKFIPPSIRPLTHAAISATFNIAVSAVTLGYFDVWCQRALNVASAIGH